MIVQEILNYLWTLAPEACRMSWDNVGLLLGRQNAPVRGVLVALDATAAVAEEAERLDCQLVVTHHPVIFHGDKHITDADPLTEVHLRYLEKGIAVISMHTNLDCAPGGVNDLLAERLGLHNVSVLEDGETAGLIRMGELSETELPAFAGFVKQRLRCPGLRWVDGGRPVRRVAVGGGACGEFMPKVLAAGCDTFVTADIKYHEFCDAATLGLNLIDAGHFETEDPACDMLAAKLRERFPALRVCRSAHRGCIRFL